MHYDVYPVYFVFGFLPSLYVIISNTVSTTVLQHYRTHNYFIKPPRSSHSRYVRPLSVFRHINVSYAFPFLIVTTTSAKSTYFAAVSLMFFFTQSRPSKTTKLWSFSFHSCSCVFSVLLSLHTFPSLTSRTFSAISHHDRPSA